MSDVSRDELDAKLATVEAKTETRIVRLEGKIDAMAAGLTTKLDALSASAAESRQEGREGRRVILAGVAAGVIALAALIVGMATYGDALFGRGMDVQKVIQDTIAATQQHSVRQQSNK